MTEPQQRVANQSRSSSEDPAMADETAKKQVTQQPKKAPENPESALSSVNKML